MNHDQHFAELSPEELRRRLAGMTRLLEVTRSLAAEVDLRQVLQTIIDEACKALDCDRASLYQYDAHADELYTTVVTELEIGEIRKRADLGISGGVARSRRLANIAQPAADARWDSRIDQITGYKTRNILAAPLLAAHDGSLLGVLQLLNKHSGPFDADDEDLITAFSQHAAVALDRARLVERLRSRDAALASLDVARAIQRGFMPDRAPPIAGYDAATWWFPNEAVGGDYCDFIPLANNRTALCIADVSGHGIGPSLLMASVRAALRALLLNYRSADELMAKLGKALAPDLQNGLFITMVLAILDAETHAIEFANAGHAPAMHLSASTGAITQLESTGLPLGVLDEPEYPEGPPIHMQPGDVLLLATDGIVEACNEENEPFGQARLEALLRRWHNRPAEELAQRIGSEVESHYFGDHPPDDLTVMVLRRM